MDNGRKENRMDEEREREKRNGWIEEGRMVKRRTEIKKWMEKSKIGCMDEENERNK